MFIRAPEAHSRSFIKAVTWRMLGSVDTFVISYFITGRLAFAASIASVETVTKVILFYGHERVWAAVPWGRADQAAPITAAPVALPPAEIVDVATEPAAAAKAEAVAA